MYRFIDYRKIFEAEEQPVAGTPAAPQAATPQQNAFDPKKAMLLVSLTEQDLDTLSETLKTGGIFQRPAKAVDKNNPESVIQIPGVGSDFMIALLIANSDEKTATFPKAEEASLDQAKTLIFNAYPKELAAIEDLSQGSNVMVSLKPLNAADLIQINFTQIAEETSTTPEEPTQAEMTPAPEPMAATEITTNAAEQAAETGELMPESAIMSFDSFVGEAKKAKDKTWIKDIDMKKGALRKEMKKGKEEKITPAEIAKSEAKLKKKDKDKKKPGLQLNAKDAKTHKRNVLAKNLMKASGAIKESRQDKIKGLKDQLVKLHEVVEKMIAQTARKNKGI